MSQSVNRQHFVTQQIADLESLFQKWVNQLTQNDDSSSQLDEALTQSTQITHFHEFLQQIRTLNSLECCTIKSLSLHFDYMQQVLQNEVKLYQQRQTLKEQQDEQKGHKFSRKSNLILKNWLYKHFSYPYPTKEQTNQLAEKCNLSYKQIQIWFINARGRIANKTYEEKKFKNIVKYKYLSMSKVPKIVSE